MNLKTEFDGLWALLVAALLLVAVGCYFGQLLEARKIKADISAVPHQEIVAVDNAAEKLKNVIEKAQSEKSKLPEVLRSAKKDAAAGVRQLNNNDITDRWNDMLGRYREDRATAKGIRSDE